MPGWVDFLSFILTAGLFGGAIVAAIYAANAISKAAENTKASLKAKGVNISKSGMSVKTSARYTREDYIDATQRGFIKSISAASFGQHDPTTPQPPVLERRDSAASTNSVASIGDKERKHRLFGMRRTHSSAGSGK
ncbi:hypothetical protein GLOTRDRAFT_107221 [Gloeophyllum trabeum ATCC 11539]|uniref:Uncharacterized protein n=1 Tax=Gloeophyllum trabeum (strain ATCC 11539 / FP-39264 / Madison 617) TaxID=670483 RepID=S7Q0U6_GLOTA|nr:uncharacterized protein GLOTRDRAFT_107221 [Gloeophyllum trabeum ATCC 11539]EPQ53132.1 hypothetical protein GLOTRDRAFT_107221 [Gloeophyllum trabeum ATCC 11539]